MKRTLSVLVALVLFASPDESASQLIELRLGGDEGRSWAGETALNVMVDTTSIPGSIQPLYLDPEVNVVTQIGPWYRFREPVELEYRPGQPHAWRALGSIREVGRVADALLDWCVPRTSSSAPPARSSSPLPTAPPVVRYLALASMVPGSSEPLLDETQLRNRIEEMLA